MSETDWIDVTILRVPAADLATIGPYAQREGHSRTNAAVARWAIIELARRLRADSETVETPSGNLGNPD